LCIKAARRAHLFPRETLRFRHLGSNRLFFILGDWRTHGIFAKERIRNAIRGRERALGKFLSPTSEASVLATHVNISTTFLVREFSERNLLKMRFTVEIASLLRVEYSAWDAARSLVQQPFSQHACSMDLKKYLPQRFNSGGAKSKLFNLFQRSCIEMRALL
jgi:hypothetical protein